MLDNVLRVWELNFGRQYGHGAFGKEQCFYSILEKTSK